MGIPKVPGNTVGMLQVVGWERNRTGTTRE